MCIEREREREREIEKGTNGTVWAHGPRPMGPGPGYKTIRSNLSVFCPGARAHMGPIWSHMYIYIYI
jgi:hypothetical protein